MNMQIEVNETRSLKVGDKVNSWGFVDCFGNKTIDRVGYIVDRITAQASRDLPYYRVQASHPVDKFQFIEGAERFFEAA
jgi:hypothetical protein